MFPVFLFSAKSGTLSNMGPHPAFHGGEKQEFAKRENSIGRVSGTRGVRASKGSGGRGRAPLAADAP